MFATPSAPEAEVVRSLLEFEDIPVVVKGMSQGPYRMGATYLLVPEACEAEARRVIDAAQAGSGDLERLREAALHDPADEDTTR